MTADESARRYSDSTPSRRRQFVTCGACGWVHYVMTDDEKAANDRFTERYNLNEDERFTYESAFRMCLQCEAPVSEFREADASDLERAEGYLVTPLFMRLHEISIPVT